MGNSASRASAEGGRSLPLPMSSTKASALPIPVTAACDTDTPGNGHQSRQAPQTEVRLDTSGVIDASKHAVLPHSTQDLNVRQPQPSSNEVEGSNLKSKSPLRALRWFQNLYKEFGAQLIILISTVYWTQGFKSFTDLATNFVMKDELMLSPAQSQSIKAVAMIPWMMKPIFGILSDSLPLWGRRRLPYLIIMSLVASLSMILMSVKEIACTSTAIAILLTGCSLGNSFNDVVIDAKVVESSRDGNLEGSSNLQSLCWLAMAFGGILGSGTSGLAIEYLGIRPVYLVSAASPLMVAIVSAFMHESRYDDGLAFLPKAKTQFLRVKEAFGDPVIWRPVCWMFLSDAVAPLFGDAFFFFQTEKLGFSPQFLSQVSVLAYVGLLIGTIVYNSFLKKVPFRTVMCVTQILFATVSLLDVVLVTRFNKTLGIPDKAFVFGGEVIADVISRLKSMPVLVLCGRLCPAGIEGTMFALLMSIWNAAYACSSLFGATICQVLGISRTDYSLMWVAVVMRTICRCIPLALLFLLPVTDPQLEICKRSKASVGPQQLKEEGLKTSVQEKARMLSGRADNREKAIVLSQKADSLGAILSINLSEISLGPSKPLANSNGSGAGRRLDIIGTAVAQPEDIEAHEARIAAQLRVHTVDLVTPSSGRLH